MKPIILSYGGGKQTIAMLVLIAQGRLPKPERIVMADTGREMQSTFDYLHNYAQPLAESFECKIEVIPHSYARQDLYYVTKAEKVSDLPSIPVFTQQNGKLGQMPQSCSGMWKKEVVIKWLKEPEQSYGRENPVIQWLGFSRDEISRCKPSQRKWIENKFPLIMGYGVSLNRGECVQVIKDFGLPEPPKSRCSICPYQNNSEWREVKESPEEWKSAIELDYEIRSRDKSNAVYLHYSGVPLIEADLSDKPERKQPLFEYDQIVCAAGCWT